LVEKRCIEQLDNYNPAYLSIFSRDVIQQIKSGDLQWCEKVPPEVVAQRDGITAVATTDPNSLCYSCHKVLTPLALQRTRWDDEGHYRAHDDYGLPIDDSDQKLVASYPFKGEGLEAFTTQAAKKERFIRTLINTHFTFYFGRDLRYEEDERVLYKRLWDSVHRNHFSIRCLIKSLIKTIPTTRSNNFIT
jgi:hypothetical protein